MPTAHIFGAGEYNGVRANISKGDLIIAADGGLNAVNALSVKPDIIIGDFDSLGYIPANSEVYPREKDFTDMSLAVKRALSLGADEIRIYGGLGGRLDHTLANIQLLAGLNVRAYLIGSEITVTALKNGTLTFHGGHCGVTLSVFAYGGSAVVTERGTKYTTDRLTISDTEPRGISNEFTNSELSVTVHEGTAIVIWYSHELPEYTEGDI